MCAYFVAGKDRCFAIYFVVFMAKRSSSPWDFLLAKDDVYSRLQ